VRFSAFSRLLPGNRKSLISNESSEIPDKTGLGNHRGKLHRIALNCTCKKNSHICGFPGAPARRAGLSRHSQATAEALAKEEGLAAAAHFRGHGVVPGRQGAFREPKPIP
jgi:hypothetical protein